MRGMWLAGGAALLGGGGGAYVGGAFDRGEYYDMAPQTAETRLAGLRLGEEIGPATGLVLRSRGPAMLRWDVMIDHERIADVRAHLEHEDTGTRVRIDFVFAFAFAKGDALMGLEEDPFLNEVAEIAMEEKIDSALGRRAFNAALVEAKIGAAAAANPLAIVNMQQTVWQNASDKMAEMDEPSYPAADHGDTGKGTTAKRPTNAKPLPPPNFKETHANGGWGNN